MEDSAEIVDGGKAGGGEDIFPVCRGSFCQIACRKIGGRLAVGDPEPDGNRIAQAVGQGGGGMGDGHAGHHGGPHHVEQVCGLCLSAAADDLLAPGPDFQAGVYAHTAVVRGFGVQIAFDQMGQGVKGRIAQDRTGGGSQIFAVDQGKIREDLVGDGLFGLLLRHGQDGDRCDL